MRSIIPILLLCSVTAHAAPIQKSAPTKPTVTKPTVAKSAPLDLSIAPLPDVPVQIELNGTDNDVLGMLKSFARGLEAANANANANAAPAGGQTSDLLLALLSEQQISAALKNIHHLHLVVYDLDALREAQSQVDNENLLAGLGNAMMTPAIPKTKTPAPSKIPDAIAFYEPRWAGAGGKRLLMADFKNTKVLLQGFTAPQGFALVVSAPSRVIVARADGYPDLEIIGRMLRFGGSAPSPVEMPAAPAK